MISDPVRHGRSAMLFAMWFDQRLPARFQMRDTDLFANDLAHRRKSRRDLLKECYQTWSALGIPHHRGWLSPPFTVALRIIHFATAATKAARAHSTAGAALTPRDAHAIVTRALRDTGIEVSDQSDAA